MNRILFKTFLLLLLSSSILSNLNAQGLNFEWDRNIGGPTQFDEVNSIDHDANENVFTAGEFRNTSDFDPGPGDLNLTSDYFYSAYVHKMDANGNLEWVNILNGPNSQSRAFSVRVNDMGDVFLLGVFTDSADFDPGPGVDMRTSQGTGDIFLWKFNNQGDYQWVQTFANNQIHNNQRGEIAIDDQNNLYLTGSFRGTVDFDPGSAQLNIPSSSANRVGMYTAKLDSSGALIWARGFGPQSTGSIFGSGIAVDASGNVLVTGMNGGAIVDMDPGAGVFNLTSTGASDIFVLKLDAIGQFIWARGIGGSGAFQEEGRRIKATGNGGAYVMGVFSGMVDFDPGVGTESLTANYYDVFVLKLDQNGDFIWVGSFTGGDTDDGYGFAIDDQENLYITGRYDTDLDLDPGPGTHIVSTNGGGATDVFLCKLNSGGQFVWGYSLGAQFSDGPCYITRTALNNIYVAGRFHTLFDSDPGPGNSNLSSNGSLDVFIAKLSEQVVLGIQDATPLGIREEDGLLLATGPQGTYRWLDCQQNMAPIRGASNPTYSPLSMGEYAVERNINGQIDTSFCVPVLKTDPNKEELFQHVLLYPNPVTERINLDLGSLQTVNLEIYDAKGALLFQYKNLEGGIHTFDFSLQPGLYILQLENQGKRERFKILKQ